MNSYRQHDAPPEGRHAVAAVVAAVVSLILHVVLYETVGDRRMTFFETWTQERQATATKRRAAMHAEIALPPPPAPLDPLHGERSTHGGATPGAASLLDRLSQPTAASVFEPPPAASEKTPLVTPGPFAPSPAPELPTWQPRQEILQILDAAARDLRAPLPRRTLVAVERQSLAPDIAASYDLLAGLPKASEGTMLPAIASPQSLAFAFPEPTAGGGDDTLPVPQLGPEAAADTSTQVVAELPSAVAPAYPMEDRLRILVTAYRATRGDGYCYFVVDVYRKDAASLPVLPRDVVFVQDTSASLGERYLHPCRAALREGVAALRPEDRFNIITFSERPKRCFAEWASPSPESLAQAEAFATAMAAGGNTDLFASMEEVLKLPRRAGRPVIALVVTDGNVTVGPLDRDSQIIGTFSRLNAGELSVFTVATSPRSNTYLLDMLSYANRGGRTAVAEDRFSVADTVREAQRSIERPLLSGVRFNFDVGSGAEVYPTLTTNLYEDRPLRLFGRVRAEHAGFAFQARGEAVGKRYDMLFEVDLTRDDVRVGTAELATQWATQRMYDLVARYARTEDPELVLDMQRLGGEFGVPVPYRSKVSP